MYVYTYMCLYAYVFDDYIAGTNVHLKVHIVKMSEFLNDLFS